MSRLFFLTSSLDLPMNCWYSVWTESLKITIFLSLRGRYDRRNLLKDRGLLRRSFLSPRNDSLLLRFSVIHYLWYICLYQSLPAGILPAGSDWLLFLWLIWHQPSVYCEFSISTIRLLIASSVFLIESARCFRSFNSSAGPGAYPDAYAGALGAYILPYPRRKPRPVP